MELKKGNNGKKTNGNKLIHFLKASSRALAKIRDFYIRSLTECSANLDYGMAMAGPAGHVAGSLPRSFSVSSTASGHGSDDYRELLRAASTRSRKTESECQQNGAGKSPVAGAGANNMARSQSVGIGRIDEEKPYECGEDVKVNKVNAYPRSRSYAVHRRKALY